MALSLANSRAAAACGLGHIKARLVPGFDADVVAVNGNPSPILRHHTAFSAIGCWGTIKTLNPRRSMQFRSRSCSARSRVVRSAAVTGAYGEGRAMTGRGGGDRDGGGCQCGKRARPAGDHCWPSRAGRLLVGSDKGVQAAAVQVTAMIGGRLELERQVQLAIRRGEQGPTGAAGLVTGHSVGSDVTPTRAAPGNRRGTGRGGRRRWPRSAPVNGRTTAVRATNNAFSNVLHHPTRTLVLMPENH
jgi:hypothetical protein